MSENIKREQCARCAIKHIAAARVLMLESKQGYPWHQYYAIGHLSEAGDEIVEIMPEEANTIRDARLVIESGLRADEIRVPDFQALLRAVAEGAMLEETLGGRYDV